MMSTTEILSPHAMLLHHFQRADATTPNLYVYKKSTPFETTLPLESSPFTAQDYFQLALNIEGEMSEGKISAAEIQKIQHKLALETLSDEVPRAELLVALKKAETIFFMKTQSANQHYHEKLQLVEIETQPYLEQQLLQDMLAEVNAAVLEQGELIRHAILIFQKEQHKLASVKVSTMPSNSPTLLVTNLLMDAAMAGHVWASVVLKAHLQNFTLNNGLEIGLPRKLLPHELYRLRHDLATDHDGLYYRTASPEQANLIIDSLFSSPSCQW